MSYFNDTSVPDWTMGNLINSHNSADLSYLSERGYDMRIVVKKNVNTWIRAFSSRCYQG